METQASKVVDHNLKLLTTSMNLITQMLLEKRCLKPISVFNVLKMYKTMLGITSTIF